MIIKSCTYKYESRITISLEPETAVERTVLNSLWRHGKLEIGGKGDFQIVTDPGAEGPTDD